MKNTSKRKRALVCGGGGFIGGHLSKRLMREGFWVRVVDIVKRHQFWANDEICDEYVSGDLRSPKFTESILNQPFDEVYQLAADMGGAGYIFTGENDANVMHNSAMVNLNVAQYASNAKVKRLFYSSSACIYPDYNQLDANNPNCEESSVYPANPDSEYGWEKLFSERVFLAFNRNYGLNVKIARYHNIFGPQGTWEGGKEKAPAAMIRKACEATDVVEVWGSGTQTRSFMYVDDCVEATIRLMRQDKFMGPVNIGSEEMVPINELAQIAIDLSGKDIKIYNIDGQDFIDKYGFPCPIGVNGRNSHNKLFNENLNWESTLNLKDGMEKTYGWIEKQYNLSKR